MRTWIQANSNRHGFFRLLPKWLRLLHRLLRTSHINEQTAPGQFRKYLARLPSDLGFYSSDGVPIPGAEPSSCRSRLEQLPILDSPRLARQQVPKSPCRASLHHVVVILLPRSIFPTVARPPVSTELSKLVPPRHKYRGGFQRYVWSTFTARSRFTS